MAKVDRTNFDNMLKQMANLFTDLPQATHKEFVKNTPIRTGNARKNTKLDRSTIVTNYPYAERLDEGYSKQSPKGMTQPTEAWLIKEINRRLKGI